MSYDSYGVLTWILVAAYIAAVPLYLGSERRNSGSGRSFRAALLFKLVLSSLCALTAWVSYGMSLASYAIRSDIYFVSLLLRAAALTCCIPADLLLQYIRRNNTLYRAGIGCFLAVQVLLALSLILLDLLSGWILTLIVVAVGAAAALLLTRLGRWQPGREKGLLAVYILMLIFMTARALASALTSWTGSTLLMFLGAALFLASDVFLGLWNYQHPDSRSLQNACRLLYFAGIMLIALSVSPMFDLPLV